MKTFRLFLLIPFVAAALVAKASASPASAPDDRLAASLYQQGQYDQAIQQCQAALQLDANDWRAYEVMGSCYYQEKDAPMALEQWDESLMIHPDNPSLQSFEQKVRAQTPTASTANPGGIPNRFPSIGPIRTWVVVAGGATPAPQQPSPTPTPVHDPNLPQPGKTSLELGFSLWPVGYQDLTDYYGQTATSNQAIYGKDFRLAGDYTLTPNFQLGFLVHYTVKPAVIVDINEGAEFETWNETALGAGLDAKVLFPIQDGVNFIAGGSLGFYTLMASSLMESGSLGNGTIDLFGAGPGFGLDGGVEILMDSSKTWALDLTVGYEALSFSPVQGVYNGQSQNLTDPDGGNAHVDLSGLRFGTALRLLEL